MYYQIENPQDSFLPDSITVAVGEDKKSIPQYDLDFSNSTYDKLYEFGFSELMEGVFVISSSIGESKIEAFLNSLGWKKI
jgi:hypothetical protein